MNKKLLIGLIIAIVVIALVAVVYITTSNDENNNTNESQFAENKEIVLADENTKTKNKKVLVVYYSAQSHTKSVAEKIAQNLNADIFEIVPEEVYTSNDLNWSNNNSRVSREHNDESLRDVKLKTTKVENWEDYDTVLIGYPIWWGIAAWPVDTNKLRNL